MTRSNVIYILGNHDLLMYTLMKKLAVEITEDNCENHLTAEDIMMYHAWLQAEEAPSEVRYLKSKIAVTTFQ